MKVRTHRSSGFTLIELIVVVVVVGILASLTMLALGQFQSRGRDNIRASSATTIAEALEKYYDTHGEYPSCAAMTGSESSVDTLLGIDSGVLKAPRSTTANSISCTSLSSSNTTDNYAYIGDGSTDCNTGASCLGWTIQYRNDTTGTIQTVSSRRTAALATSGQLSLTATAVSTTEIDLSWGAVANSTQYTVEASTNSNMSGSSSTSQAGTAAAMTGLIPGKRYYFRVTPTSGGQNGLAGLANAITLINPPTGTLTTASALVPTNNAQGTASAVSCPAGTTLQYQLGSSARNTNSTVSISWASWGTGTTLTVPASQGYNYIFQSQARCVGSDATSGATLGAQSSGVTQPINTPAAPTWTGSTSMAAGYRYLTYFNSYCPSGTWLSPNVQYYDAGFGGNSGANVYPGSGYYNAGTQEWWYLGWAQSPPQVSKDIFYYSSYVCATSFATSPRSPTTTTDVYVYCEAARQSYSASPRCDNYGQDPNTLPWGP